MKYASKVKTLNYALPVIVAGAFALFGSHATRSLFAQTPPQSSVSVSLPQTSYHVGEDIAAMVSNTSSVPAYVANHCPGEPLTVYRLAGDQWVVVHAAAASTKCAGEPSDYEVPAHSSVRIDYSYWPDLFAVPGTYRIQATNNSAATFTLTSQ